MEKDEILKILQREFNSRISLQEKRKNIYQIILPIYSEDGDMIDIFIDLNNENKIIVSDFAKTLMKLSYSYEIDTSNKEKIFHKILSQNFVKYDNGKIYVETGIEDLYSSVMQLSQVIAKVSNMKLYKREVIRSLFFEMLTEFIDTELKKYEPVKEFFPLEGHEEYKVDFCFNHRARPVYLFGVPDSAHARLATISCLNFQKEKLNFKSAIVLESLDILSKKDQMRLMSASDKEFPSLDDFKENAIKYLERELIN